MGAEQFQNIKISPSNPYRNLAFQDPNGDGMRQAQAYEVQMGGSSSGANQGAGPLPNAGAGTAPSTWVPGFQTNAPAAVPATSTSAAGGVSGQIMDLYKPQGGVPSAPASAGPAAN